MWFCLITIGLVYEDCLAFGYADFCTLTTLLILKRNKKIRIFGKEYQRGFFLINYP